MAGGGNEDQGAATGGARPPQHRRRLIIGSTVALVLVVGVVAVAATRTHDPAERTPLRISDDDLLTEIDERITTTAPSTTEATTTTTRPGPDQLTMAFAGDLLPHAPLNAKAGEYGAAVGAPYDYRPMLAPMKPVLESVDAAVCHMEVPVSPDGTITAYPSFGAPPELVDAVADAGYDGCSTGSNHSLDRGVAGLTATLDRFDQRRLRHAGTARTAEEAATVTTYDLKGAKVAHLSYAYGFNGYQPPADQPYVVMPIDSTRIRNEAAAARKAGAQFVVVSLHWGTEYQHDPSDYQRQIASEILPNPDIDLVVGHHAHVVQPIEKIGDTYVAWGLGNQLANQPQPGRSDGLTVKATATKGPDGTYTVTAMEAVPTYVDHGASYLVWPIVPTLQDPATPQPIRDLLYASYDRTAEVLSRIPTEGVTLAPRP